MNLLIFVKDILHSGNHFMQNSNLEIGYVIMYKHRDVFLKNLNYLGRIPTLRILHFTCKQKSKTRFNASKN